MNRLYESVRSRGPILKILVVLLVVLVVVAATAWFLFAFAMTHGQPGGPGGPDVGAPEESGATGILGAGSAERYRGARSSAYERHPTKA